MSSGGAGAAGSAGAMGGRAGTNMDAGASGRSGAGGVTAGSAGANAVGGNSGGGSGGTTGGGGAEEAGGGGAAGSDELGPPGPDGFAVEVVLASDIKETAPTTVGIVRWTLDAPGLTEAHIDFGLDTTYGMTAPVDLTREHYRTVLVGMKPESTYHFRIVATDASGTRTSDDRTLTTGAPTTAVAITSFSSVSPEQADRGFFIGSFWKVNSDPGDPWMTFIVDTDGDIVWWYTAMPDDARGELGFGRARLSADSQKPTATASSRSTRRARRERCSSPPG